MQEAVVGDIGRCYDPTPDGLSERNWYVPTVAMRLDGAASASVCDQNGHLRECCSMTPE